MEKKKKNFPTKTAASEFIKLMQAAASPNTSDQVIAIS